jgi:hypothetical protein
MTDIADKINEYVELYRHQTGKLPTMAILKPGQTEIPVNPPQSLTSLNNRDTITTPYGNISVYRPKELSTQEKQRIQSNFSKTQIPLALGRTKIFRCLNHHLIIYDLGE